MTTDATLSAAISRHQVTISQNDYDQMRMLVRDLDRLSTLPGYHALLADRLPEVAAFDPGQQAVLLGYDFHLTADGPRLIEVNSNAGGLLLAARAMHGQELVRFGELDQILWTAFCAEYAACSHEANAVPQHIAIIDETPEEQFLYPELEAFAALFRARGCQVVITDPTQLSADHNGLCHDGQKIDLIYNRHCDFLLKSSALAEIRAAYLNGSVCLTPNPRGFALLSDKERLVCWSAAAWLQQAGLEPATARRIATLVPEAHLLADLDPDECWQQRKQRVFKPVDAYASRGVYTGEKLSRKKFAELDPATTLVQQLAPPSLTATADGNFKTDLRLFARRDQIIALTARLYRGQVTNLRTEGGGFAAVQITAEAPHADVTIPA
ncbi:MAG: hypothetical protein K0A93_09270 [Desulfuromonadaceae bacterium]|nr:hypothetical protein [Desulfuromonadaceae bacterium]